MGNIFGLCKKYLKKNIRLLILYGILCLCSSFFAMISPYLSGNFIDCLVVIQSSKMIYRYCILFILIAVFSQILGYLVNRLFTKLQTKLAFEFNKDMISHVQKLPLSYISKQDMAYLNQRINNDTNMLMTFCISILQGIIINSLKLTACIFLLIYYSFYITILLIIILFIYILIYKLIKNILFKMRYMLTESQASYFSKLYEQLNNIIFIKVHAINNEFIQRLEKEFKYIFKVTLDYQKVNYIFSSMDSAVLSFAQICIFIMGGLSVIKGKLTIGQLTIILSYFNVMMESASYFFSFGKTI